MIAAEQAAPGVVTFLAGFQVRSDFGNAGELLRAGSSLRERREQLRSVLVTPGGQRKFCFACNKFRGRLIDVFQQFLVEFLRVLVHFASEICFQPVNFVLGDLEPAGVEHELGERDPLHRIALAVRFGQRRVHQQELADQLRVPLARAVPLAPDVRGGDDADEVRVHVRDLLLDLLRGRAGHRDGHRPDPLRVVIGDFRGRGDGRQWQVALAPGERHRVRLVFRPNLGVGSDGTELLGVRTVDGDLRSLVDHVEAIGLDHWNRVPAGLVNNRRRFLPHVALNNEAVLEDDHIGTNGRDSAADEQGSGQRQSCEVVGSPVGEFRRRRVRRSVHCSVSAATDQAPGRLAGSFPVVDTHGKDGLLCQRQAVGGRMAGRLYC